MQTNAPAGLHVTAHAKVNLLLRVLGRRPDGFHEIHSAAMAVGLCDDLLLRLSATPGVRVRADDPALPTDERNLVLRAANLLADHCGIRSGAEIELCKRIPVAAGLGGGSSDAAATLRGLDQLWETGLSDQDLIRLGAEIGSDVPLFFAMPVAKMSGRGDRVEAVQLGWSGWVLLIFGEWPVSTPRVYNAWAPEDSAKADTDRMQRVLEAVDACSVMAASGNDLEAAVFRVCPAMRTFYETVSSKLDQPVRVSGAGSTLFTLFDDQEAARRAAAPLTETGLSTALVGGGSNAMANL